MSEKIHSRLSTLVSFTIAILTLFSGLLGWQMGNISGEASSEYSRAQRAELNRQKISSTNSLKAYEDSRAFLVYKNYFEQYKLVSLQLDRARQADPADERLIAQLSAKQDELESLYLSSLKLFPNQFINRDGTYNIQEELGQLTATEGRRLDTNPETFEERGAKYDTQVGSMQIALIVLALSLFFFAIVSTVEGLNKIPFLSFTTIGYIAAIAGVIMGVSNWNPSLDEIIPAAAEEQVQAVAAATFTPQPAILNPPTPTILPTETMIPVQVAATFTPDTDVPPPQAPSIESWDFFCSNARNTMGIEILWTDAATNESGYRIIRNGEVAAELPAGTSSFDESIPLIRGARMIYQIEIFNGGGSTFSMELSFTC